MRAVHVTVVAIDDAYVLSETAIEARIWCEDVASRHEVGSIGSQNAKTDMCGNSRYVDRLC